MPRLAPYRPRAWRGSADNARRFAIPYIPMDDHRHGIVHVIGPELGFTLPGCTLVCGDSHTCTHGAFGAMAFGIGSSECECIFATQTLRQRKQKRMRVTLGGELRAGVTVKDIILALIAEIGVSGGVGFALEYTGPTIASLSRHADHARPGRHRRRRARAAPQAGARRGHRDRRGAPGRRGDQ